MGCRVAHLDCPAPNDGVLKLWCKCEVMCGDVLATKIWAILLEIIIDAAKLILQLLLLLLFLLARLGGEELNQTGRHEVLAPANTPAMVSVQKETLMN